MFSGIIEELAKVDSRKVVGSNIRLGIKSAITHELKVDQSVAHNGVCLTVVAIEGEVYFVDVIRETLNRSNLGVLEEGNLINIERSIRMSDRLDGHVVQGHVDQTASVVAITENQGSWTYRLEFETDPLHVMVEKGSVTVNGVSLTVSALHANGFEISIIPYTHSHTNFHLIKEGDIVNVEFDVIGKYVERLVKS